jgi:hypothetical protein
MRNPACTTQRITAVIKQIVYASPFNAINLFLIEAAMGGFLEFAPFGLAVIWLLH